MIEAELAAFLQGPVIIVFATGVAGVPAIGRALGIRILRDGEVLDLFVASAQWTAPLRGLTAGAPMAVTASHPQTYRAFQLKGRLIEIAPADEADRAASAAYVARLSQALPAGSQPFALHWLRGENLVRLRFSPVAFFAQTPGPGAGAALGLATP